jgi:hypothetical protein
MNGGYDKTEMLPQMEKSADGWTHQPGWKNDGRGMEESSSYDQTDQSTNAMQY